MRLRIEMRRVGIEAMPCMWNEKRFLPRFTLEFDSLQLLMRSCRLAAASPPGGCESPGALP